MSSGYSGSSTVPLLICSAARKRQTQLLSIGGLISHRENITQEIYLRAILRITV
jgi:hypothetical protein